MHTQTVNLTRSLLQDYDKALAHTHAHSHNYSLVDSFRCLCLQLAKKLWLWTDEQYWHTYRQQDLTERVQLASYGSCKRNRCARYFDLGEYQMRCGSGGGKGGHRSVPILGNCNSAVGGERRSGEERLLEAILIYDDKTLKWPLLISSWWQHY